MLVTADEVITASVDGAVRAYDLRSGLVNVDECHEALSSLTLSYDGACVRVYLCVCICVCAVSTVIA